MPDEVTPESQNPPAGEPTGGEPVPQDGAMHADELAQVKALLEEEQRVRLEAQAAVQTATETLQAAQGRITELEAALAEREQLLADRQVAVADQEKSLAKAAGKYRDMLLAQNPAVPPELVTGSTLEEVDASLKKAQDLVARVRAGIAAQAIVPAGAPVRSGISLEGLSPGEKIRLAVRGKVTK